MCMFRFVSYFLRGESSLRERIRPPLPPTVKPKMTSSDNTYMPKSTVSSPMTSGNCVGDSFGSDVRNASDHTIDAEGDSDVATVGVDVEVKSSKKGVAAIVPQGLFITKGALVDWRGVLALTVMGIPPLRVHFSEVVFEVLSMSVAPRLILSVMNASLVGIVCSKVSPSCDSSNRLRTVTLSSTVGGCRNTDCVEDDTPIPCKIVRGDQGADDDRDDDVVETGTVDPGDFKIQYRVGDNNADVEILPECIGLGIVRSIDVQRQLLYVITPLLPVQLNNLKCKHLTFDFIPSKTLLRHTHVIFLSNVLFCHIISF